MKTRENTSTPSREAIREQLKRFSQSSARGAVSILLTASEIGYVLQYHPDLGLAWYEKFLAFMEDAQDALDDLEEYEYE